MDWSKCPDVERAPGKVSGAWVVKGTRVPVQAAVDNAEDGYTPEEIIREIFGSRHGAYACSSLIPVGGSNSRNSPSQGS